jgi:ABC-type multidrug transport system fused ATPase/permease subunit
MNKKLLIKILAGLVGAPFGFFTGYVWGKIIGQYFFLDYEFWGQIGQPAVMQMGAILGSIAFSYAFIYLANHYIIKRFFPEV